MHRTEALDIISMVHTVGVPAAGLLSTLRYMYCTLHSLAVYVRCSLLLLCLVRFVSLLCSHSLAVCIVC